MPRGLRSEPLPCFLRGLEPRVQCLIDIFPQCSGKKMCEQLSWCISRAEALKLFLSSRCHRSGVYAVSLGMRKPQAQGADRSGFVSDSRLPCGPGKLTWALRSPCSTSRRWEMAALVQNGGDVMAETLKAPESSAPIPFPLSLCPRRPPAPAVLLVFCCVFAG